MNAEEYLRQLVAIDSTREKEEAVADFLEPHLHRLGFDILSYPHTAGRRNILASRGANPRICVYGHMDTVPVYNGWATDPFTLTRRGDKLYGLGASDMKGGIAALLAALEQLPRSTPLKLLFCYDEEYDSDGAWAVANNCQGWFAGITHVLSVESGVESMNTTHPSISLGRRGRARFMVNITGFSAHGSNTNNGINAIDIASQLVPLLNTAPMATHSELGTGTQYVARIEAGNTGLSIPDRCQLEIERHFVPPETVKSVLAGYRAVCAGFLKDMRLTDEQRKLVSVNVQTKQRANPYMEPFVTPVSDLFARRAMQHMDAILGGHRVTYGLSVADDNILATICKKPVIVIGPRGGNEHSPNEWVYAESLNAYATFYEALLK
jgi:succinyl-diaminopimelate desuccinylase